MKGGSKWVPFVTGGKPEARRAVPIHGYVGPNGSGKSLAAVFDSMPSLDAGRPVLSTVRLLDWKDPRPCEDDRCQSPDHGMPGHMAAHPFWIPLNDFRQLFDVEHCDVLMDEVTGVADAREHQGMPVQVRNLLVQLRRRDVILRWTSPAWAFADVTIRRVSQAATVCSSYFPTRSDSVSMWRPRRGFVWRTYDARDLDEFDSHKREQIKSYVRQCYWGPGSDVFRAYDTRDQVLTLGAVNEAGLCMDCGGRRSAPRCSCTRPASSLPIVGEAGRKAGGRSRRTDSVTDEGPVPGVSVPPSDSLA